jgi:transposase-like protein
MGDPAMTFDLTNPIFHDEDKAREWLEGWRWPHGVACPHCGSRAGVSIMGGQKHRPGLYHCRDCRGQFTVRTGSAMESSHVPLPKWVLAIRLMASANEGFSALRLHRSIGVTYKTAWFMFHRLGWSASEGQRPAQTRRRPNDR